MDQKDIVMINGKELKRLKIVQEGKRETHNSTGSCLYNWSFRKADEEDGQESSC